MSKKKKNLLALLGLTALLILCLVFYFVAPKSKDAGDDGTEEEAKEEITVDQIDSGNITGLEIQKDGKTTLSLVKKEKKWHFKEDKSIPLDEEAVTGLFDCLSPVKATKTMEKDDAKLADYGLDHPSMTIAVTAGNTTYQYQLGIAVPVEGGYYGTASAGDKIYCMKEELYTTFDISRNVLIKRDELPEIESGHTTYLLVDNKKGKDFEAKAVGEEERVDPYSNWNITKPYDKPLAASVKDWSTTLSNFTSLSFEELVQYRAEDLSEYGLQDPSSVITVTYYEAKEGYVPEASATPSQSDSSSEQEETIPEKYRTYKTLQLCIGKKEGENYYVCKKGSRNVYTMTAGTVEAMTKLDAYSSMDHSIYSVMATDIKGYEVTCGDTTLKVTRKEKKEEGDDSKNIWTLNGKEIASDQEEDFLKPYSAAYLLTFTAKAKPSVKPKSEKPVLTIVYHEDKRDVTVRYLPYDGTNFYRVDKNGMNYFLTDKLSVDAVIAKFKAIEKLK